MGPGKGKRSQGDITVISTGCGHDCGGRCVLKAYIKDGVVVRVETDDGEEPQLRACLRGRAMRQELYSPDRLKFPMKRVGERGEGKFERISWGEALDTVATRLQQVKKTYGPSAIFYIGYTGTIGYLHNPSTVQRLLNMLGGCTTAWGDSSAGGARSASMATYGTVTTANSRDDLLNSRMIIMWGWNPTTTIHVTTTTYYLRKAKEAGIRIICVDPVFSNSVATFADQWIPVRPGTDTAMLIAMAYVIIKENLQDQGFIDAYTVGFDKYKDYLLGLEDGVPKTPAWAEKITGVPAATIQKLAREYATAKPAALLPGWGPGRTAYGEQYHRAAMTLATMTGNVGVHGGNAAGYDNGYMGITLGSGIPAGSNPAEEGILPPPNGALETRSHAGLHRCRMWDAILGEESGGYHRDIKMLYVVASNPLNQAPNLNKGVRALKKLDFIVVHEQFMTATARFADILLPINTNWERNDITRPWVHGTYFIHVSKLVDSLGESKSDFEICVELARRLGIENYSDKTEGEWLREICKSLYGQPDYDTLKKNGVYRVKSLETYISFEKQVNDPKHYPFPTPSGKIEIYSQLYEGLNNPELPSVPKYIESWEGHSDPLTQNYPLQLITARSKRRAHSCYETIPWLQELERQAIWINPRDASSRGVAEGDEIKVFNERGQMILPVRVTERIMPGVVLINEGAWYLPDEEGIDRGGCPNTLTKDTYSPGGAFPYNTCLVQVERAGGFGIGPK
ncbi:MAG: molybdopterin-dependent oxidoreductase [Chloroflexi bacterium]|nr:molybdopterin-dependent oxidoreductase [Chloroflexota bacterium]